MFRPARNIGVTGALLSIGLIGSTGFAAAKTAGHHGHFAPLKGVVTAVSTNTLQLQTPSGAKSVGLTSATRIVRIVSGTSGDLIPNARVDLHLVKGTTTINAVQIDAVTHTKVHTKTMPATHTKKGTGAPHTAKGTARTARGDHAHSGGQISAVNGNNVTIRDREGQTKTYTLANNTTITKTMSGAASDLSVGETVQAFVNSNNAAIAVTILNA